MTGIEGDVGRLQAKVETLEAQAGELFGQVRQVRENGPAHCTTGEANRAMIQENKILLSDIKRTVDEAPDHIATQVLKRIGNGNGNGDTNSVKIPVPWSTKPLVVPKAIGWALLILLALGALVQFNLKTGADKADVVREVAEMRQQFKAVQKHLGIEPPQ